MSATGHCKDCKYFGPQEEIRRGWSECLRRPDEEQTYLFEVMTCCEAALLVSPNFGCIEFVAGNQV